MGRPETRKVRVQFWRRLQKHQTQQQSEKLQTKQTRDYYSSLFVVVMMCNKWPPNLFTTINLYFSIICLLGQLWLCFGLAGLDRACVDWGVGFGSTWNRLREQSLSKACGSGRGWKDKKQKQTQVMPLLRTCTCHFLHMAQPRVNEWGSPLGEQGWEGGIVNK